VVKTAHDERKTSRILFVFNKYAAQMSGLVAEWTRRSIVIIAVFGSIEKVLLVWHFPLRRLPDASSLITLKHMIFTTQDISTAKWL
jgi:hypothetical protein